MGVLSETYGDSRFKVILADPPWPFKDKGSRIAPENEECGYGYETMTTSDIAALDVRDVSLPNAALFLWSTRVHVLNGSATHVARSWGFEPRTWVTWVKMNKGKSKASYSNHPAVRILFEMGGLLQIGMGHYSRGCTEPMLICTKIPGGFDATLPDTLFSPRSRHSVKPDSQYDYIDTLIPEGERLELFARRRREGWESWGLEI